MKSVTYYTPALDRNLNRRNLRPVHKQEAFKVEVVCLFVCYSCRENAKQAEKCLWMVCWRVRGTKLSWNSWKEGKKNETHRRILSGHLTPPTTIFSTHLLHWYASREAEILRSVPGHPKFRKVVPKQFFHKQYKELTSRPTAIYLYTNKPCELH